MQSYWQDFRGATIYEFRMQIHRIALWATFLGFAALVFAVAAQGNWTHWTGEKNALDSFANWIVIINLFIPPALGILLADRAQRDRKLHVDELINTTSGSVGARLLGKYTGTLLATLLPMVIIYAIGIGYICLHWQALQSWGAVLVWLPDALALFLTVVIPGTMFIAAFSLALPLILWVPLYQFLFICYWFWGNVFAPNKGIPTLSNTILTPFGGYMLAGFFKEDSGMVVHQASVLQGLESLFLLIGIAAIVLALLWYYLRQQRVRA